MNIESYVESLVREATKSESRCEHPQSVKAEPEREAELEALLKGFAIELWSDALGERFWLVADETDAASLREPRGTVYTAAEARRIIQIGDPAIVAEIHKWKRHFDGVIREQNARVEGKDGLSKAQ